MIRRVVQGYRHPDFWIGEPGESCFLEDVEFTEEEVARIEAAETEYTACQRMIRRRAIQTRGPLTDRGSDEDKAYFYGGSKRKMCPSVTPNHSNGGMQLRDPLTPPKPPNPNDYPDDWDSRDEIDLEEESEA